jgi:nanoRNase/pAp phosphatase (c-di-AMP/oligoRNAs hydrolase)
MGVVMSRASQDDLKSGAATAGTRPRGLRAPTAITSSEASSRMNTFVEACVQTVAGSAQAAQRRAKGRPHARKLLKLLEGKTNVLITAHEHPDPDAIGSAFGLMTLLSLKLPAAKISVSFKGRLGGGINDVFFRETHFTAVPWDDARLAEYDAIILLDAQPAFAYSPLPAGLIPTAVIDHHRPSRGRRPKCSFCDIRTDVGATTSVVFSYFLELEAPIESDLAAIMLYAIETDLAGAAGQPGELDNVALSNLTLKADMRKLYRMRYASLPPSHYVAFATGLNRALVYDSAVFSYLGPIDSPEKPAVVADFLLRLQGIQWSLVLGVYEGKLVLSLRASNPVQAAGDVVGKILRGIGEGGGHRTKAGGIIRLKTTPTPPAELDRLRTLIRRRFLKLLGIPISRGQKLVPNV